ncbi:MAG: response regulator, partial [Halolamina sp.]
MNEPLCVLHVDDESEFADMTSTFLQRESDRITVETAASASEGLERLAAATVDCVVSDFEMPGRDGIEFLTAVREEYPDLPFILFTGRGSEEVASDAISAGANDYLQKGGPDSFALLANRIENVVEQRREKQRRSDLERVRNLVSEVNQTLVRSSSLDALVGRVCDVFTDTYRFALFSDFDPETDDIEPRTWAGEGEEVIDAVRSLDKTAATAADNPLLRAVRDREVTV